MLRFRALVSVKPEVAPLSVEERHHQIDLNWKRAPLQDANFLSRITYSWANGLMFAGSKRALTDEDIWPSTKSDIARNSFERWSAVRGEDDDDNRYSVYVW